jgi:hypothetical protein
MANRLSHSLDHIEKHTPLSSHEENMDASTSVKSKNGQEIQEGDHVYTRIRGGRHEGDVSIEPYTFFSSHYYYPFRCEKGKG